MGIITSDYSRHKDLNDFIAENHSRKKDYLEYRERWKRNKENLLFLLIETNSLCNLKCPMCVHSLGYKPAEEMNERIFDKVLENIDKMKIPSVCMNQANEPLLDKNICLRTKKVAGLSSVVDIHMNTNAVLLDRQKSEEVLQSGLTRLLIGFDAFSKRIYEDVRAGANFELVLGNILNLLGLKARKRKKLPVVRISFVRISKNEHEIKKWSDFWKDKADYISVQEYVTPVLDSARDFLIPKSSKRINMDISDITCEQPFERAVIRGNGDVLPCCSPFAVSMPLGNILDTPLEEIWKGEAAVKLRKYFLEGRWLEHPICSRCLGISHALEVS